MDAVEMKKGKKFKLFKKEEEQPPEPEKEIAPPPPPPQKEDRSQEEQINIILLHLKRIENEVQLARAEFINLLENS